MRKSTGVLPNKRGHPAKGKDPMLSARFPRELTASVVHFAKQRDLSRSEAIRYLVEQALEMFNQANRGKRK